MKELRNKEVIALAFQLDELKWTKEVPKTDENETKALLSLFPLDELLNSYKNLVKKTYSKKQLNKIDEAIDLVFENQGTQLRKEVSLYPGHPIEVSYNLVSQLNCTNLDLTLAGLLHDVVEDVPEYNLEPSLLGKQFGSNVQHIVQGLSNKLLPLEDYEIYKNALSFGLKYDKQLIENILPLMEYFVGVKEEIKDPQILIVKAYDFGTNALKLDKLSDAPELQSKLANKYLPLFDEISLSIGHLIPNSKQYGVSAEGLEELRTVYNVKRHTVKEYAYKSELYEPFQDALTFLNLN